MSIVTFTPDLIIGRIHILALRFCNLVASLAVSVLCDITHDSFLLPHCLLRRVKFTKLSMSADRFLEGKKTAH